MARRRKLYRGSKRRLQNIKFRGNWSAELWVLVVAILFTILILVPWLIRHPPLDP
jgi:hypothetical protein